MSADEVKKALPERLKDDQAVADRLRRFADSVQRFADADKTPAERFPGKWVAILEGKAILVCDSYEAIKREQARLDLPSQGVLIRYIAARPRSLLI